MKKITNKVLVDIFSKLELIYKILKDDYRVAGYKSIIKLINQLDYPITKQNVYALNITKRMRDKILEILNTGRLRRLDELLLENPHIKAYLELMSIGGIGPSVAKTLINKYNILSISDLHSALKRDPTILNDTQKIYLKYAKSLSTSVPRATITKFAREIKKILRYLLNTAFKLEVVGSYRRGKPESGDIDLLITATSTATTTTKSAIAENAKVLKKVVEILKKKGVIVETLAEGEHRFRGIVKSTPNIYHQLDILIVPYDSYYTALMHSTGSAHFNTYLRNIFKKKGCKLSEYSLTCNGKKMKINSEEQIFKLAGLPFIPPSDR
jgi:DNA polymerase/3'-5' exonuclease PolX